MWESVRGTDQIKSADDFTSTNTITRLPGKTLSMWRDKRREAGAFELALGKRAFVNDLFVMVWQHS